MKLSNISIDGKFKAITDFPPVVVDQTNFRISDVIKRNRAGEQVLGHTNMQYDFDYKDKANYDTINPFNALGFDLDDVIVVAKDNNKAVLDLQNNLGEISSQIAKLDKSKDTTPPASSDPPKEVSKND